MKRLREIIFLCFFIAVLVACNEHTVDQKEIPDEEIVEGPVNEEIRKETMPVTDYISWVRNPGNGLAKVKTIDELKFVAQYKPYEYMICMEEQSGNVPDTLMKRRIHELEGFQYYDLKMQMKNHAGELLKAGLKSTEEYDKRVRYFSFDMQRDIQLVDGTDTLPCVIFHFERAYDVTPECTVLLGFEKIPANAFKPKTLLVYDRTFNKGLLKFTFKEKRLQTLPKLLTL